MERHPEEDHDHEYEDECRDALLGLLLGEFHHLLALCSGHCGLLFGGYVGMFEALLEAEIDGERNDEREACYRKAHVVGAGQRVDVRAGEVGDIARPSLCVGEYLQFAGHVAGGIRILEEFVGQRRYVGVVEETVLFQLPVGDGRSGRRCVHRADVDGHVEDAECAVAFGAVTRVVVEVTYHYLQVAFEKARADADQYEGSDERNQRDGTLRGNGHEQVAQEHDHDTQRDHLAVSELIGKDTADERHEIDPGKEKAVELACLGCREAELCLKEQHKNGEHRVVTETLARVGQSQSVQAFGMSFEHKNLI